ncbi:MAG TPA: hypothetical protein VFR71_02625 [Methyloceanibacter sp.]|jgi:hypothetical protein|nr:hypothetical protein [Methyloceanibacter sp.]
MISVAMMAPEFGAIRLRMHRDPTQTKSARRVWLGVTAALIAVGAGLLLGLGSAARAADPARPYLGMSKEEIIACAGEPHARYKSGSDAETLTYRYTGAGPVPPAPGEKKKKDKPSFSFGGDKGGKGKKDQGWTCTASLVFQGGRLARVSFAHKDVKSPYDWQKEKDPKKQAELRAQPVPTCDFSLPNCNPGR